MATSNVYISVTEAGRQLVIDGPLDLFQKFLITLGEHKDQTASRPESAHLKSGPALETKDGAKATSARVTA